MQNEGILQVRMLGEFSMIWRGREICGGIKAPDAQFTRLLQLLLHNRKTGIERTKLQSLLFDDSNSEDVHHLLRTVIYNTRKKLSKSGLPGTQFIEFRDGRYYWTSDIPVQIDTELFEKLCAEAEREQDDDARLDKYMKAISAYKGSFLPNQTRLTWAVAEERRYKALYTECVEEAARLLRKRDDYVGIEMLGRAASAVCPLNDWEHLIMEAYVYTGRTRDAQVLYEKTFDYYQKKLGSVSILEQADHVDRLLESSDRQYAGIENIAAELMEDPEPECGGYYCSYPVFRGICQMLDRSSDDQDVSPYLMICSVDKQPFRKDKDARAFEKHSDGAKEAICRATEKGTVICGFCMGQFLIMIPNGSEEICSNLQENINTQFRLTGLSENVLSFRCQPLRK